MTFVATQEDSSHVQSEVDKEKNFIEHIQHIYQQVHDILDRANAKYKQWHDQHRVQHKFQVGDKVWLHLQKERLAGTYCKIHSLWYGSYTIIKVVGDNSFELHIPPFLGLYPMFNVDRLRPYFPPLLDTSDMAEQLTPTELNPDCMEQAELIKSWIHRSSTLENKGYHYIELSKQANSFTKANGSPRTKFSRSFLISWRNSTQWGPFLPKVGGMI